MMPDTAKAPTSSIPLLGSTGFWKGVRAKLDSRARTNGKNQFERAFRNLRDQVTDPAESSLVTLAACFVLLEKMTIDRPTALRQACAIKLYELADKLAEKESAPSTEVVFEVKVGPN